MYVNVLLGKLIFQKVHGFAFIREKNLICFCSILIKFIFKVITNQFTQMLKTLNVGFFFALENINLYLLIDNKVTN